MVFLNIPAAASIPQIKEINDCTCSGLAKSYNCTIESDYTGWGGSVFNCFLQQDGILIPRTSPTNFTYTCDIGNAVITGRNVEVSNNLVTSLLTISNISLDMESETVNCTDISLRETERITDILIIRITTSG